MLAARLVGWLLETEGRHTPKPVPPARPLACPACDSLDIHGARPCARRPELEDDTGRRGHDWHCHACPWSWYAGDRSSW